ncbi:MAG: DUF6599 family protein, partial [Acidobacteriota bacterium]
MPDHHLTRTSETPRFSRPYFQLLVLLTLMTLPVSGSILAQSQPAGAAVESPTPSASVDLPSVLPGSAYHADRRATVLSAEQYAIVNGAEVFVEYGLERVTLRRYVNGRSAMTVEVFQMRFPTGAYGLLSFNRGSLPTHRREFSAGRYLVSIAMENPASDVDADGFRAVEQLFSAMGIAEVPPIVSHLPSAKRIEGSEKYLVGPAALSAIAGFAPHASSTDFTGGVEVAVADYQTGDGTTKLVIIEYHTPQSASFGFESANTRLDSLTEQEKDRRILKRVGNYVVEAKVDGDRAAAQSIVGQIKYEVKIYWEGKKFTSIPFQYRPPDPAAIEEMRDTATVLLRTFYGIGLMLVASIILGVFSG